MPDKTTKDQNPASIADIFKSMQTPVSMTPLFQSQVEQFWETQERMLNEAQAYSRHWFERRHEAIRTALETARSVSSTHPSDSAKAMQAMLEWQQHSTQRLVADAQEWFETVSRCAGHATESEVQAMEQTMDELSDMAEKATKSSKSEPV